MALDDGSLLLKRQLRDSLAVCLPRHSVTWGGGNRPFKSVCLSFCLFWALDFVCILLPAFSSRSLYFVATQFFLLAAEFSLRKTLRLSELLYWVFSRCNGWYWIALVEGTSSGFSCYLCTQIPAWNRFVCLSVLSFGLCLHSPACIFAHKTCSWSQSSRGLRIWSPWSRQGSRSAKMVQGGWAYPWTMGLDCRGRDLYRSGLEWCALVRSRCWPRRCGSFLIWLSFGNAAAPYGVGGG